MKKLYLIAFIFAMIAPVLTSCSGDEGLEGTDAEGIFGEEKEQWNGEGIPSWYEEKINEIAYGDEYEFYRNLWNPQSSVGSGKGLCTHIITESFSFHYNDNLILAVNFNIGWNECFTSGTWFFNTKGQQLKDRNLYKYYIALSDKKYISGAPLNHECDFYKKGICMSFGLEDEDPTSFFNLDDNSLLDAVSTLQKKMNEENSLILSLRFERDLNEENFIDKLELFVTHQIQGNQEPSFKVLTYEVAENGKIVIQKCDENPLMNPFHVDGIGGIYPDYTHYSFSADSYPPSDCADWSFNYLGGINQYQYGGSVVRL